MHLDLFIPFNDNESQKRDREEDDFSDETDDNMLIELQKPNKQEDDFSDETDDDMLTELQKPNKF